MNVDEKVRCSITASLDLARSEMTAKVCLHLKGEPLTEELTLQINPGLQVTRVQSQGVECGFSQTQSDRVSVTLPKGMSDSHLVLELDYAGYLPQCDATEEEGRAFITDDFFWLRDDQYWFPVPVGLQEEMFPIPPGRYVVQMQLPSGWEVAASSPLVRRWNEGLFECYQWDTQDEYPGISMWVEGCKRTLMANARSYGLRPDRTWLRLCWALSISVRIFWDLVRTLTSPS